MHTPLGQHARSGKTLTPPLMQLSNVALQSWINDRLPDVAWAALLTLLQPRERYLALFRAISDGAHSFKDAKAYVTHTELSVLSDQEFDLVMAPVLRDSEAKRVLSALLLLDSLPDKLHWRRHLSLGDHEEAWDQLAHAILENSPHQSQEATDIRWLKVRFMIIQGRMRFGPQTMHMVEEILDYPSKGDMRSVRPSIRSMEGACSGILPASPQAWCDQFWKECLEKTLCSAKYEPGESSDFPFDKANEVWGQIYVACADHFMATVSTTAIDPRHDGAFGLALYGLTLIASVFRPNSSRPAGRVLLRTLVETYLTLAFLVKKDEPKLWTAYRSYGGGQAKLAFLKLVEADELPKYVDLDALEALANEDIWQEYLNIDLGHWANKDLRKMSEEIGVKPVYDKYYGWPSTFVHGQWGAVRSTVFALCLNPLHRLHRVPRPPRTDFEDVSWDAVKLGNLILELVNEAYPGFEPRFRLAHSHESATSKKGERTQSNVE